MLRALMLLLWVHGPSSAVPPTIETPTGFLQSPQIGTRVTAEKVRLGRWLFFDRRLSADRSTSCATCHRPERAFTDEAPLSTGVYGRKGHRRSQPLLDIAMSGPFFWDGRAATLVEQAKGPLVDPREMGNRPAALTARLRAIPGYRAAFKDAFGTETIDFQRIAEALAAYESTLASNGPRLPELGAQAQRGLSIFLHRARCGACHRPPDGFSDRRFHNLGIGWEPARATRRRPHTGFADPGRRAVTGADADTGAFKTPMLFDLARRAPYMHDGSLPTLRDVIDFYDRGGRPNPWLDPTLAPLALTEAEKTDLLAFLLALRSEENADDAPLDLP